MKDKITYIILPNWQNGSRSDSYPPGWASCQWYIAFPASPHTPLRNGLSKYKPDPVSRQERLTGKHYKNLSPPSSLGSSKLQSVCSSHLELPSFPDKPCYPWCLSAWRTSARLRRPSLRWCCEALSDHFPSFVNKIAHFSWPCKEEWNCWAQGEQLLVSAGTSKEIDIKPIVPMYGSTRSLQLFQLCYILTNSMVTLSFQSFW